MNTDGELTVHSQTNCRGERGFLNCHTTHTRSFGPRILAVLVVVTVVPCVALSSVLDLTSPFDVLVLTARFVNVVNVQ